MRKNNYLKLKDYILSTKIYKVPTQGTKYVIDYGYIVSIKNAAKDLNKSKTTIRRWAKELEEKSDNCSFRWDKKFGLLYYYANSLY